MEPTLEIILWIAYFFSLFFVSFWLLAFFTERPAQRMKKLKKFPMVSVIIPAYNEEKAIEECMASLAALDYPRQKMEIIVVNDGSKDRTKEIAWRTAQKLMKKERMLRIRVFSQQNKGKGAALNNGLQHARGKFFVCLDADSRVSKEALQKMLPYFLKNRGKQADDMQIAAVLPCLKVGETKNLLQKMQRYEYLTNMFYKEIMSRLDCVKVTPGPFAIYRKSVLKKLGGFDEHSLTEDLEIALRLQKRHYRIVQTLDTDVLTLPPDTLKGFYTQRNRWYKGSLFSAMKYKKMLFNKKWGDFGLMEFPTLLVSGVLTVTLVGAFLYYTFKPLLELMHQLSLVHFDVWMFLKNWVFEINPLEFNYSLLFLSIAMTIITLFVLWRSHLHTKERIFRNGLVPLALYSALYYILLGFVWVGIFWDLVRKKKQRW